MRTWGLTGERALWQTLNPKPQTLTPLKLHVPVFACAMESLTIPSASSKQRIAHGIVVAMASTTANRRATMSVFAVLDRAGARFCPRGIAAVTCLWQRPACGYRCSGTGMLMAARLP